MNTENLFINDEYDNFDRNEFFYDTPEEIQMCLNCNRPECVNCLRFK